MISANEGSPKEVRLMVHLNIRSISNLWRVLVLAFALQSCLSFEQRYMKLALNFMEKNSINRKQIQWKKFRKPFMVQAGNDKSTAEVYRTLQTAINALADGHSFLATPERISAFFGPDVPLTPIEHRLIDGRIACIKMPAFIGNDSLCALFSIQLQSLIKGYDEQNISSWIIDLRENYGGNMWPMMLGASPLLGEGIHGYFVDPDSNYFGWKYHNGSVFEGEAHRQKIENPYKLKTSNIKIAVLIGKQTGSSGEAIAVCFKGLSKSRFFGERTYGLVTSNNVFDLPDGAELVLTVSRFCDRNRSILYQGIEPDELITVPDSVMGAAVSWITKDE